MEHQAPIIRAASLTKRYGRDRGVDELDFAVAPGEVFGFLGPNGAGKTTTIRLLLDLIRPTSGRIELFGSDPRNRPELRARIGYLPGDLRLYEKLTGRQQLGYFAGLRGLRGLGIAPDLAERFDVDLDRPQRALSRGNRQKIGILQAFMHEPDLLILDEPTSGLDPLVQQTFNGLLADTRASGRSVFISSHVLPEVQHVADRVALLREGRIVLVGTVDEVRRRAVSRVEVTLSAAPPQGAFEGVAGVRELERDGARIVFALQGEPDALVKALARYRVVALESREPDLEDVFLALYGGEGAA